MSLQPEVGMGYTPCLHPTLAWEVSSPHHLSPGNCICFFSVDFTSCLLPQPFLCHGPIV